jgi:hypothetical protein
MYTIVSAFISSINQRTDRSTKDYINFGKELLQLETQKIIFVESKFLELVKSLSHKNTIIVPIEYEEIQFYDELKESKIELPFYRNLEKDTKEYMTLMTNKTYFCQKAIDINPQKDGKYVWIDFGISHILKNDFRLSNLVKNDYDFQSGKIRIAGIWNKEMAEQINNLEQINWFFAGGIFGGYAEDLLKFHHLVEKQFRENLKKNKIIWEVNLWYQIYQKNPELFEVYSSNHNESLIQNL